MNWEKVFTNLKRLSLVLLLFVLVTVGVQAEESMGTPEAKAEYIKGEALMGKGSYPEAAEFFRKAIEIDPNYGEAHSNFLFTYRQMPKPPSSAEYKKYRDAKTITLIEIYNQWIKKSPKVAGFYFGLGDIYKETNLKLATQNLNKALKLDQKFARAWQSFALIADVSGDVKKQIEYYKKAAESAPDNPAYLFYYANTLENIDFPLFEKVSLQVAEKFPTHMRGAQALYWLGNHSLKNPQKAEMYLNKLLKQYPVNDFSWSSSGAGMLFRLHSKHSPEKALALAEEMVKTFKDENSKKMWQTAADYQKSVNQAKDLMKNNKHAEAFAILDKLTVPRFLLASDSQQLKNEALEGSGQVQTAYDNLVKQLVKAPTDNLRTIVNRLGTKLGKNQTQIEADVWQALDASLKPAKPFKLVNYATKKEVNLEDYRGKVVMINFWYPYCGPCRGENPSLDKVQKKIGRDKFEILAINVHTDEDEYVLPYLKGMKFDFVPLRGSQEFAEKDWNAYGYPTNYLIDPQGRMTARLGNVVGEENEHIFELQIRMMLERAGKK